MVVAHARVAERYAGVRAQVDAVSVRGAVHLMFGPRGVDQPDSHDGMPVFYVGAAAKQCWVKSPVENAPLCEHVTGYEKQQKAHWNANVEPCAFFAVLKASSFAGGELISRNWCGVRMKLTCWNRDTSLAEV